SRNSAPLSPTRRLSVLSPVPLRRKKRALLPRLARLLRPPGQGPCAEPGVPLDSRDNGPGVLAARLHARRGTAARPDSAQIPHKRAEGPEIVHTRSQRRLSQRYRLTNGL